MGRQSWPLPPASLLGRPAIKLFLFSEASSMVSDFQGWCALGKERFAPLTASLLTNGDSAECSADVSTTWDGVGSKPHESPGWSLKLTLAPLASLWNVYTKALPRFSHICHPDALHATLISQVFILETAPAMGKVGRTHTARNNRSRGKDSLTAWSSLWVSWQSRPPRDIIQQMRMVGKAIASFALLHLNRLECSCPKWAEEGPPQCKRRWISPFIHCTAGTRQGKIHPAPALKWCPV